MRALPLAAATLAAAFLLTACSDDGGGKNCGFQTLAQCQAAISGNGGYCNANPMYRATTGAAPLPAHRPQR